MTTEELLEGHPLATKEIKEWLYKRMMETVDDSIVDPDFKEMMFSSTLNNEKVSIIIEAQPSALFEMFDEYEIYIYNQSSQKGSYHYNLNGSASADCIYNTRKGAEKKILEIAFSYLEQKLQLVELPNLEP